MNKNKKIGKPFLKWAGGKTQLLDKIEQSFPRDQQIPPQPNKKNNKDDCRF